MTSAPRAEGRQFRSWPGVLSIAVQKVRSKVRPQAARLGRQSEASQSSSIMGSRDAGPAYGTKKNLILAGLEPAVFWFRRPTPYPLGHRTLHAKPRKDHTECGARRKIKTKEEKMTGGRFGLLARRSLTRRRKCPRQMATRYRRQSPYRLVVRKLRCGRDNPGSAPGEDISLGQSDELAAAAAVILEASAAMSIACVRQKHLCLVAMTSASHAEGRQGVLSIAVQKVRSKVRPQARQQHHGIKGCRASVWH